MQITTIFYTILLVFILTFYITCDKLTIEVIFLKIRGTKTPKCDLCVYSFFNKENKELFCNKTMKIVDSDFKCSKFTYDITKYKPKQNMFKKFKQEDFEI